MTRRSQLLIGISATAVLFLIAIAGIAWYLVTKSFPTVAGEARLRGLKADVQVFRDDFGVAHVFAESEHDAYFGVGYVHAQDRLWQLELTRRAGMGRLAEILGEPALPIDKMFRTVGLRDQTRRLLQDLDPPTVAALQAYADGINAFISTHKGRYPIEFDMLSTEPEPWTIEHSLAVSRLMAWELNYARWVDLVLSEFVVRFGEARARELFPQWPAGAPVIVPKELMGKGLAQAAGILIDGERAYRTLLGIADVQSGSNAWVISGKKSSSGKPILANDPHLMLMAPARWYELSVTAPGLEVSGASIPGVPFVVIGRNRNIAWGVTNAMMDDEDFYIEQVDSAQHPTRYRFNDVWRPIVERVDTILVRNGAPVLLTVYATHRGPIVNKIEPTAQFSTSLVSMRWTGHERTEEARAFYLMNRAANWSEFKNGLRFFGVPAQNFVYADVQGNIGYYTAGLLPIRATKGPTLSAPGWTDEYDWRGFVPFDKMPHVLNPPTGFIATANNKIVDDSYPYYISDYWEPSWRISRITEILEPQTEINLEDVQRLQCDLVSTQARELVPTFLRAYAGRPPENAGVAAALNYFRNWDYEMRREDVSTTLFEATLGKLIYNTFHDEFGSALLSLYDTIGTFPLDAVTRMLGDSASSWFDDIHTPQRETRDEIIRKSLNDAVDELHATLGGEVKEWRWGRVHRVTFHHIFAANALLKTIFDVGPVEVGGSHSTVWKGDYHLSTPFENTIGPSLRMVIDLGDVNNTRSVIPPGQSGQVFQKHYDDQMTLWLNAGYKRTAFDRTTVEHSCRDVLRLRPQ